MQKMTLLKNSKDVLNLIGCLQNLMAWNGCSGKYKDTLENDKEAEAIYFILMPLQYICGKKIKLARTSEYLLSCWKCMIVNVDS